MITFDQLWVDKYAALHAAAIAEEEERRAEDFLDVTRTVCGLELRPLTPRDLLHLDYVENPFVAGGEITAAAVAQFLWQMHAAPPPRPRFCFLSREKLFFRHCAALLFVDSVDDIQHYIDRTFADFPKARCGGAPAGQPVATSFLAPLIVKLAAGIPSLTPQAVMDTPMPQLFQFQMVIDAKDAIKEGRPIRDRSQSNRLYAECLDEVTRLNAAEASNAAR